MLHFPFPDPCSDLDCGFGARCMIRIVDEGGDVVSAADREPFCSCDAICDGDDEEEDSMDRKQGRTSTLNAF